MSASDPQNEGRSGADEARLLELELAKAQAEARAAEMMAKARALEAELARKQAAEEPAADQPSPAAPRGPEKVTSEPVNVAATPRPAENKQAGRDRKPSSARREFAGAAHGKPPSAGAERDKRVVAPAAGAGAAIAAGKTPAKTAPVRGATGAAAPGATGGAASRAEPAEEPTERRHLGLSRFLRASSSWMLSMVMHLLVMIILGLWLLPVPDVQDLLPLLASVDADQLEELEDLEMDEFEMDQMEALAFDVQDPGMAELGDTVELEPSDVEVATMSVSDTMDTIGALFGEHGKGWATAGTGSGGAEFYGAKTRGKRFVFVIDNSLSMTKGRFESALYELMYTIGKMGSDQEFYIFFFSDTAYPLFYPNSAKGPVKATNEAKQAVYNWLATVHLVLRTDAKEAVQRALLMQPDGIYILTDGAFTDDTARFLLNKEGVEKFVKSKSDRYYRPPTIHTVGMEIGKAGAEKGLKDIAQAYNGSFRHVRSNPQMQLVAKRNPRPRHSQPGPLWGIALGNRPRKAAPPRRPPQPGKGGHGKKGGKKN